MPFDTSHTQPPFLSEKARRLLEAHDREVNRQQDEAAGAVEFSRPAPAPCSKAA